jgi:hypothetical protein
MDDQDSPAILRTVPTEAEAQLIVAALGRRGIDAWTTGELTSAFRAEAPGGVRVLVRQGELEQAEEVLSEIGPGSTGDD